MKRLMTLLLVLLPSTAFAQKIDGDALLITTTTSSGIMLVTSGIVFTEVKHHMTIERNIRLYKQQNNTAIQSALRLGGGVAITDLAKICGLDSKQTKMLGKRLRANRKTLSKLNDEQFAKAMYKHANEIRTLS